MRLVFQNGLQEQQELFGERRVLLSLLHPASTKRRVVRGDRLSAHLGEKVLVSRVRLQ
mgnify:CR=1 FL=1